MAPPLVDVNKVDEGQLGYEEFNLEGHSLRRLLIFGMYFNLSLLFRSYHEVDWRIWREESLAS